MLKLKKKPPEVSFKLRYLFQAVLWVVFILVFLSFLSLIIFDERYAHQAYPNVFVGNISVGGQTQEQIQSYWLNRNVPFRNKNFEFRYGNLIATASATELDLGYDATLSATQALTIGRSQHAFSNFYVKFLAKSVNLAPYFRWNDEALTRTLTELSQQIDIPVQDALFQFNNGRVTAFKPSHAGRRINQDLAKLHFQQILPQLENMAGDTVKMDLPVDIIQPAFSTDQVNSFGIKELIGRGYSEFAGSISGRVHNVVLAAARINGILIKPGETFSFNDAVGDITAATGYESAYIIKEGHTVLGDGGGVCQVSTTLFRAAMNAGLPIVERHAHAYRVHYYEEAGEKPGLDATVYGPSIDFRFKNDTPGYILIQTKADLNKPSLTFELYGTSDGRRAEILDQQLSNLTPPPPPLYQDDPTLRAGAVKQVDFEAWGAKASFRYRVTRNGQILQDTKFVSNFQPWQAVFLRGTQ